MVVNSSALVPTGFQSLGTVTLTNGAIISATSTDGVTGQPGGTIRIRAGELVVSNSTVAAEGIGSGVSFETAPPGGNIDIHASDVTLDHATISTSSDRSKGGPITFSELENMHSFNSAIEAIGSKHALGFTGVVRGGSIQIGSPTTNNIVLTDTTVSSFVFDSGGGGAPPGANSGDITLTGEKLLLDHSTLDTSAGPHSSRAAGIITLNGDHINLENHTTLRSLDTSGGGGAGTIIQEGRTSTVSTATHAKIVNINDSEISTFIRSGAHPGSIAFHADQVTLNNATLTAGSFGLGGTLNLADVGSLKSTNSTLNASGFVQDGGTILLGSLTTESITLNDTTVSVRGMNGGNINIMANRVFNSVGSTLDASGGNGGTIYIQGKQGLQLTNSTLTTSTPGGPDTIAGQITLESNLVKLQNSQVLSTSTEGQGGTIAITTPKYRADSASVLDASSELGTDGTVTISKP